MHNINPLRKNTNHVVSALKSSNKSSVNNNTTLDLCVKSKMSYYLVGFADGEGSFNLSFRQRESHGMEMDTLL